MRICGTENAIKRCSMKNFTDSDIDNIISGTRASKFIHRTFNSNTEVAERNGFSSFSKLNVEEMTELGKKSIVERNNPPIT